MFLKKAALLLLLGVIAPVVHLLSVYLIWGKDTQPLQHTVQEELQLLGFLAGPETHTWLINQINTSYHIVFIDSGLQSAVYTSEPSVLRGVLTNYWKPVQALLLSLQLMTLRISVLILCWPFFTAVLFIGISDGLLVWYQRRTSSGRESGFIYHRAKWAVPVIGALFWITYVVPPVVIDPRYVIPPFLLLLAVAVRFTVAYFKKYL